MSRSEILRDKILIRIKELHIESCKILRESGFGADLKQAIKNNAKMQWYFKILNRLYE